MTNGPAIVRPWLKAGLSVLLLENEERVAGLRSAGSGQEAAAAQASPSADAAAQAVRPPAQARPAMPQAMRQPPVRPSYAQGAPQTKPASPVPQARQAAPQPSAPARQAAPAPAAERAVRQPSSAAIFQTPGALPVEAWPAGWLALKDRRPLPSRPLVLWTYAGLGEDLTGTPDRDRRQVVVRMLTELRHPGGTHVFWPFSLAGEAPQGASLFWSGVKLLDPRVLLLFGSDTRDALAMPKTLLPFCQERVYGRLVIQLPRPQALAADEASFRRAQAFLANLLRFCERR